MVGLKFLRKYLSETQFLSMVVNSFYSTIFYASTVKSQLKSIDSLFYRLLRTACRARGYRNEISKTELVQRCKQATPKEWVKYLTTSSVVKIIRDCKLVSNYYEEPSGTFFDRSWSKTGHQSLENLLDIFKGLQQPWNTELNNDKIRILLKKTFFQYI